jgi:hypothetical protein
MRYEFTCYLFFLYSADKF